MVSVIACSQEPSGEVPATATETIIYGEDGRYDPFEHEDQEVRERLQDVSVALVPASRINNHSGAWTLESTTLGAHVNLCSNERFFEQPVAADCSGTLIASDLVLTAGHCLVSTPCIDLRLLFDYRVEPSGELFPLRSETIFRCSEVVSQQFDAFLDFAVIRLDRPAEGRTPAKVRIGDRSLPISTKLTFVGYPNGLPMKIADDAFVSRDRSDTRDYFAASLDAFPGSSGSGVFLADSLELVGVLARGPQPAYGRTATETCTRPIRTPDTTPGAVESTYVARAIAGLCSVMSDSVLCSCGNGQCDASRNEDSRSCPQDCGTRCGDGECNGEEDGENCYSDCGSCGDSICEPYEVARLSCCGECGCPNGLTCNAGRCQLQLGNVNGDDRVDEQDASLLRTVVAGEPVPYFAKSVGDVDCDGQISDSDARHVELSSQQRLRLPCERIRAVVAGAAHTCALGDNGRVYCWGNGASGQLGYAKSRNLGDDELPSAVGSIELGGKAIQIAAGRQHNCALLQDRTVRCWGLGSFGQLGYGRTNSVGDDETPASAGPVQVGAAVEQIVTGGFHSCALLESGEVKCWGENTFGQLGYGHKLRVGDDETPEASPGIRFDTPVRSLAAGLNHTCAHLQDNTIRCWGWNIFGQLGYGHVRSLGGDESVAVLPAVSVGASVSHLAAGFNNTCAALSDGTLKCWGDGGMLQLGNGGFVAVGDNETPASVASLSFESPVVEVAVGELRVCARTDGGATRCWGQNGAGQLGMGNRLPMKIGTTAPSLAPLDLGGIASRIAAGGNHSCAIIDAQVACWGKNESGQLGHGNLNNIGDDEVVREAGSASVFPTPSAGWRFVNSRGLGVVQLDRGSDDRITRVGLLLTREATTNVSGLKLLYLVDTSEAPDTLMSLGRNRPYPSPWRLETEQTAGLQTVVMDLFEPKSHCSGAGHLKRTFRENLELHFSNWSRDWTDENDYSAIGRYSSHRHGTTERVQIVDQLDTVVYGWTRQ
jgi:alpha-tubulin suppressor-like RCC1 family protein